MDKRQAEFDTFSFQGKEYKLNTAVKIKPEIYIMQYRLGKLCDRPLVQLVESFVDWQGTPRWSYAIWDHEGHIINIYTTSTPEEMIESIIETPNEMPAENAKSEYYKDSEVKEVIIGWAVYIFVMFFSLIFKGRIVLWTFATVYFFYWRDKKLKKPKKNVYGYNYYEKVREWDDKR